MEFIVITQQWYSYLMVGFWICVPLTVFLTSLELFFFSPRTNKIITENFKLTKENKYLRKELTKYKKIDIKV